MRKALISANAFSGSSFCTGFAAYSGDTNVMEKPPKRHGSVHPATAGVASRNSVAMMMHRCNIVPPDGPAQHIQECSVSALRSHALGPCESANRTPVGDRRLAQPRAIARRYRHQSKAAFHLQGCPADTQHLASA